LAPWTRLAQQGEGTRPAQQGEGATRACCCHAVLQPAESFSRQGTSTTSLPPVLPSPCASKRRSCSVTALVLHLHSARGAQAHPGARARVALAEAPDSCKRTPGYRQPGMHAPHQLAVLLPQSCGRQRHRPAGSCVALAVRPWAGLPWQAFRFIATPPSPSACRGGAPAVACGPPHEPTALSAGRHAIGVFWPTAAVALREQRAVSAAALSLIRRAQGPSVLITGERHGRRCGRANAMSHGRSTASAAQKPRRTHARRTNLHRNLQRPASTHATLSSSPTPAWQIQLLTLLRACAWAPCPPSTRGRALDSCDEPACGPGGRRQGRARLGNDARRQRAPARGRRGGRARRARAARCRTRRTSPRPRAASRRSAAAGAAARPPGSAARWPRRIARRRRRPPSMRPPAAAAPPLTAAPWPPAGAHALGIGHMI